MKVAPPALVREESISRLERIVSVLFEAQKRRDPENTRSLDPLCNALAAQCPKCRMLVTGDELFILSELPAPGETDRIRRLRSGQCVQEGCSAHVYQLLFHNHPDIDWRTLFAPDTGVAKPLTDGVSANPVTEPAADETRPLATKWKTLRLAALIASVFVLLAIRQCYRGGRIPLIREPENFQVDPLPESVPR